MGFAKYKLKKGNILKDGHTMFLTDVIRELNRKSKLEEKKLTASNIERDVIYSFNPCDYCISNEGCSKNMDKCFFKGRKLTPVS